MSENELIFKFSKCARTIPEAEFRDGGGHIYNAVGNVLFALDRKCCGLAQPELNSEEQGCTLIGVLWFCKTNKGGGFITDALELCNAEGRVDGLLIVTGDDIEKNEVPFRESPLLCAHKERVQICRANFMAIGEAAAKLAEAVKGTDEDYRRKLAQVVATYAVFQPISVAAGHGARNDVSNRILAPARLSAELSASAPDIEDDSAFKSSDSLASCWRNFIKSFEVDETPLGKEFKDTAKEFKDAIKIVKSFSDVEVPKGAAKNLAAAAEMLMTLMTECRRSAGIVTEVMTINVPANGKDGDFVRSKIESGEKYRLLVVDDHWNAWKPVLDAVVESIKGADIDIVYSPDGKVAWGKPGDQDPAKKLAPSVPILSAAFQADAILLDILLGDKENGLNVLKQIRAYSESIPVLLWTTTRSQEITNQAQQANGVILKKTCKVDAFAESLAHWLSVGHARRGVSLLNPFFDSVIKRPDYRKYARDVSEWALKWMAGFHATSDYFREFTDHSARHFTKVLVHLEHAIQPLLGSKSHDGENYFAPDADTREQEFLVLYVAVFLHELGMFPFENELNRFRKDDYVSCVRDLHAPRGMLLIESGRFWVDKKAWEEIYKNDGEDWKTIRMKIAVLVGYHARFFESFERGSFLKWPGLLKKQEAVNIATKSKMFGKDASGVLNCEELFKISLNNLKSYLDGLKNREVKCEVKTGKDDNVIERLSKLCALLRICDAIDKDHTRIPASYLSGGELYHLEFDGGDNAAYHNLETMKQEICSSVQIKNGRIDMAVSVPPPASSFVNDILNICTGKGLGVKDNSEFTSLWKGFYQTPAAINNGPLRLNKSLGDWLKAVWKIRAGCDDVEEQDIKKMLSYNEMLEGDGTLNDDGLCALKSVTALASGVEIFDEYKGLVETGLSGNLQLGDFAWGSDNKEIERKWLITLNGQLPTEPEKEKARHTDSAVRIVQGYFDAGASEYSARIRNVSCTGMAECGGTKGETCRCYITAKTKESGVSRNEYEREIPPAIFDSIWPLVEPRGIEKTRFYLPFKGKTIELDVYGGKLSGLVVAEVEFDSEMEALAFEAPGWFGKDVTHDRRFKNHELALSQTIPEAGDDRTVGD